MSNTLGCLSKSEQLELIDREEDAVLAVKASKKEGIVEGGGVALLKAITICLDNPIEKKNQKGYTLMLDSLKEPARKIMNNADMVYTERIIKKIINGRLGYYDITKKRFKEGELDLTMFTLHIVDPYKVIRTAIANAVSIARLLLQTALIITKE